MKTPSKSILDVGVQNAMNKSGTGPGDPVFTLRFPNGIPLRGIAQSLQGWQFRTSKIALALTSLVYPQHFGSRSIFQILNRGEGGVITMYIVRTILHPELVFCMYTTMIT